MPVIKPISDLNDYPNLLKDVGEGEPVYLTENGTGRYVLMDIGDYGRLQGASRLSHELRRGRRSGEEQGWIPHAEVVSHFEGRIRV